ncbi:MATE family efflux transporter [Paenibacillus sp. J2TS4]|uniref:MATE family efflux transporter n=1 Tax=Paenibacillus sp. J2TS4 TaxID=2807194 RepID=UPI001AFD3B50|nr:MATE family efflux transporter [Paenibacillus sp. J2TS4]GIP32841.1 MATE family efflux transporter [Paenibacillus sp. J2TS4]
MKQTFTVRQKMGALFIILFPILVTQVAMYAMSFFDTVMSGNVSPEDLAGVAIGSSLWMPVFTGLTGILMAVTPTVAQLVGAGKRDRVPLTVMQGLYLSAAISVLLIVLGGLALNPILNLMDLEESVRHVALNYLFALAFGVFPLFMYTVLRCFIDALGHTRVTMIITLLSLPINVFFNYVLIFGKFGFPAMGGIGAGVATSITYWCICVIAAIVVYRNEPFSGFQVMRRFPAVAWSEWFELLKIGVPIGLAIMLETGIFAAVTLLMSNFNTITIAAHQAAINFASFLYMIPMSISMGLTIMVGYEIGARRPTDAKQYSYIGIGMALMMSTLCAIALFIFNGQVAGLYSNDSVVIELTKQFLYYAIFFQLSDAIAAPIQGALRGYKDVNVTFIVALISFWGIGLPVGYVLANYTSLGAYGYWIGLIAGLALGAFCLLFRLLHVQRKSKLVAISIG